MHHARPEYHAHVFDIKFFKTAGTKDVLKVHIIVNLHLKKNATIKQTTNSKNFCDFGVWGFFERSENQREYKKN